MEGSTLSWGLENSHYAYPFRFHDDDDDDDDDSQYIP
jgi:hypothetical protein